MSDTSDTTGSGTPAKRPGEEWMETVAEIEPGLRETWTPGDVYAPHDGETSDMNLHYADLMAPPRPEMDPARTWLAHLVTDPDTTDPDSPDTEPEPNTADEPGTSETEK